MFALPNTVENTGMKIRRKTKKDSPRSRITEIRGKGKQKEIILTLE
jgi:hypothetical protein